MNDYVPKPVHISSLSSALVRALDKLPPASPEKKKESDTAVLDRAILNGLRELREANQPDPVAELIDLFLQDAGPRLEKIKSAIAQRDKAALISTVHALKGSASNLGARTLAAQCATFEKKAKAGDLSDAVPLFERLNLEFDRVRRSLLAEKTR
jgi:HPt (histidine-containing phosphotransfer) domain-containing protein